MIPLKRRKVSLPVEQQIDSCTFPHVSIFILERKMGTSRRAFLTRLGRSKGFLIKETYSSSITHVVSENNSGDEVQAWLDNQPGPDVSSSVHLLDIRWFTESMEAGRPVIVQDRHKLKVQGHITFKRAVEVSMQMCCRLTRNPTVTPQQCR